MPAPMFCDPPVTMTTFWLVGLMDSSQDRCASCSAGAYRSHSDRNPVSYRFQCATSQSHRSGRPTDMIRLIAAIDSQRGIATDSGIPWKLPGDSAYFREKTASGLIVMGRATYDEFAAPLHGGDNYVLSTATAPLRAGFESITGLQQLRAAYPDEDIWVIGGATVYRETIG